MNKKIVLKASAGTGKTYRLSLEYLAALLNGRNYSEIFVMTFTKKATSEIKERIVEFLQIIYEEPKIEDKIKEKNEILNNLVNLYPELDITQQKIEKIYFEVLENVDRLKIYTIDGFINTIFKNVVAPGIGMESYEIVDIDEENYIYIRLLEKIFKNEKSFNILKNFLENNIEKKIENYIELLKTIINSRWKHILINESGISIKKERVTCDIEESLSSLFFHMIDIMKIIYKVKEENSKKESEFSSYFKKGYIKFLDIAEFENHKLEKSIMQEYSLFLTDSFWNGVKVKSSKASNIDSEIDRLEEKYEEFKNKISTEIYNEEVLKYEEDILSFIEELYNNYDEIKLKEGKLTFSDVSNYVFKYYKDKSFNLFDENGVTDYFYEIFEGKISTLFIDEFQDTSILQWKLLKGLADRSDFLICVGDEKQSIYRWRGGEKELFEKLPKILEAEEHNLDTCFRSKNKIVEFLNSTFSIFSSQYREKKEEDIDTNWNFIPVKSNKQGDAHIEIVDGTGDENSQYVTSYDAIVDILKTKFNEEYKSVAVIARTNDELNEMALKLSEEKIPFIQESNENIFSHRAIESIYKLLEYIVYLNEKSLYEFLRTDLLKYDSQDLKEILINYENIENYILQKDDLLESLISKKFINDIEKIKEIYKFSQEKENNLKAVILKIIKNFSVINLYNSPSDIKNIYRFIELGQEYSQIEKLIHSAIKNPNNSDFSQVATEEKNAVTLITIHKSKGLEYETVFYIYKGKEKTFRWKEFNFMVELDEKFEKIKNFAIFREKDYKVMKQVKENEIKYIEYEKYKSLQEDINSVYVGLTRAKTNIFIIVSEKTKKENMYKLVLEQINVSPSDFKNTLQDREISKVEENTLIFNFENNILNRDTIEENMKLLETQFADFSIKNYEARLVGTAIHYYLENIKYLSDDEVENAKIKCYSKFASSIGKEKLEKIFNSEKLNNSLRRNSKIFSKEWDEIYSEYELFLEREINEEGIIRKKLERKILDRVMIKKAKGKILGEILIVDYKTGARDQIQLEQYIEAIEKLLEKIDERENYKVLGEFITLELPSYI